METNSQNGKSEINYTLIIIVALVCLTAFFGITVLGSKNTDSKTGFNMLKSELPLYISWRETKWPGEHTQVAMIWPKSEAKLPLRLTVQIENSATGEIKSYELIIDKSYTSKEPFEFGRLQGHRFVPGDKIKLMHKDYSSLESMCSSNK
jgi:hypothetical protein